MRRLVGVSLAVAATALLAGAAFAQQTGPRGFGPGGMMMGRGMSGTMGGGPGSAGCPGWGATAATAQITEEKARELATQYAEKYLSGFTVERVLPFTGMHHTMYQAELKGPQGERRVLHINPWGNVMPFGGPQRFGQVR